MTIKLLILFISGFAGAMIGSYFYKRARCKVMFFSEAQDFCNFLINDIGFRQQPIKLLTKEFLSKSKSEFSKTLEAYLKFLEGEEFVLNGKKNSEENEVIKNFFMSIGKTDAETQVNEIKYYKDKFTVFYGNAEKTLNGLGRNYIKLGFLCGLVMGLLLI